MEKILFICDHCKKKVEMDREYILTQGVPCLSGQFIPNMWICLECFRAVRIEIEREKE